jgi:uncharacterized protein YmfQ (DUF2313 family)
MALTLTDRYVEMMKGLLPRGMAWSRDKGTWLEKLFYGLADEFVRIHERAMQLIAEADPRTATESLSDWERLVGLPDDVQVVQSEVGARRADIIRKLALGGGQSAKFFEELAAQFGYTATVRDLRRFTAGRGRAGEQAWDEAAAFYFEVKSPDVVPLFFRAGQSSSGDALRVYRNDILEAVIRRAAPAHTHVIFAYS